LDLAQARKGRKPKKSTEKSQSRSLFHQGVRLAADIYRYFEAPDLKREFRMRDLVRAAAVSIVSNNAEGFEYRNDKQFIRFLTYSKGSLGEMRSQLFILYEAGMLPENDLRNFEEKAVELGRRIGGFIKYLESAK
jgi:four helix bundle protein